MIVQVFDFNSVQDLNRNLRRMYGAQIAAVARAQGMTTTGTLTVGVASSQWLAELQTMERELLTRHQARIAGVLVERIRFVVDSEGSRPPRGARGTSRHSVLRLV